MKSHIHTAVHSVTLTLLGLCLAVIYGFTHGIISYDSPASSHINAASVFEAVDREK